MTPIAGGALIPNPFERFSEIAFGLIMAVSFCRRVEGRRDSSQHHMGRLLWCWVRKAVSVNP